MNGEGEGRADEARLQVAEARASAEWAEGQARGEDYSDAVEPLARAIRALALAIDLMLGETGS